MYKRQYNECLSIWLSRKNSFHRDVIEEMAKNYAAGACYHIGEIAKAKKMFIETGDIISYVFCINKEGDVYKRQLRAYPDNASNTKNQRFLIHILPKPGVIN